MSKPWHLGRQSYMTTIVSVAFSLVIGFFLFSFFNYWTNDLQPRLKQTADTQAHVLAQSYVGMLSTALREDTPERQKQALQQAINEMLLVSDPAIEQPAVSGVRLLFDYGTLMLPEASLDMNEGDTTCDTCFVAEVPIMGDYFELLGIARFYMTDAYYQLLATDIRKKLLSQAILTVSMIIIVWLIVLFLVSKLYQLKNNIEKSDKSKSRFMANVSHELRTPLNAILGYTQLFRKNDELMQKHGQGVLTIHRSAEHLLLMINDILDFSKMESQNIQLYPSDVDVGIFLNTLVEMTQLRTEMKDIRLKVEIDEELPEALLFDEKRLRQILLNLLNNAVKFTEKGEVTFKVDNLGSGDSGKIARVRFTVKDTGVGIPAAKVDDIFLPYQQVENSITRAEGSGLGLTISQLLVELMGGRLTVKSEEGEGSTFSFAITAPVANSSASIISTHTHNISGYQGDKTFTIMSVDDNVYNRDVIRQHLEQYGFDVVDFPDGHSALKALAESIPDLVLLDLSMPVLDGHAVIQEIRKMELAKDLPVIALTAVKDANKTELLAEGFDDLLNKPVREEALQQALANALHIEWVYADKEHDTARNEADDIQFPAEDICQRLLEAAGKHNILQVRELLDQLQGDASMQAFLDKVRPMASAYQFGKIQDFLKQHA